MITHRAIASPYTVPLLISAVNGLSRLTKLLRRERAKEQARPIRFENF